MVFPASRRLARKDHHSLPESILLSWVRTFIQNRGGIWPWHIGRSHYFRLFEFGGSFDRLCFLKWIADGEENWVYGLFERNLRNLGGLDHLFTAFFFESKIFKVVLRAEVPLRGGPEERAEVGTGLSVEKRGVVLGRSLMLCVYIHKIN